MVAGWGEESDAYAGHRLTLYRDPEIKYGGAAVGGIAISHMSHMDKPLSMALTVTRGKRKLFTVKTLAAAPALKQADLTIPAKVLADTAKALAEDTVDAYLEYLAANNAPAHILNYVTEQTK
jgi:hypothetical protein